MYCTDHESDDKQYLHIAIAAVHQHQIEIDLLIVDLCLIQLWNEFTFKLTNYILLYIERISKHHN